MIATQCSCGFAELADEELTDHLELVFEPDDLRGNDGQVHQETDRLTCSCGLAGVTTGQLDRHFLRMFTPANEVGRDGQRHSAVPIALASGRLAMGRS
ncbi:MAG TPA: hypothetical protein VMU95_24240 [Trebonia sp.]|nr:hypothetical protein [Trebonia sp.]